MNIITAITSNGCIGLANDLVVKNKDDMKFFKETTEGHNIIMGRKTFESLGNKALPNRKNIVISSSLKDVPNNVLLADDLMHAIALSDEHRDIFFIGGGEIYREAIKIAKKAYISVFEDVTAHKCDVFFPMSELKEYELINEQQRNGFKIREYIRK